MLTVQMRQQASDHRSRDATPAKSGLRPHINYIGVAHAIGQDPRRADDPRAGVGEAVEEAILRGLANQAPEILRISYARYTDSFAPGNTSGFDLLVLPRHDMAEHAGGLHADAVVRVGEDDLLQDGNGRLVFDLPDRFDRSQHQGDAVVWILHDRGQ